MRKTILLTLTVIVALCGCNNEKKPSATNFTNAINAYLAKHGQVCALVDQTFPANVTLREQKQQTGIGPQAAALEQAGLVRSNNTTAVVHELLNGLSGPTAPQPEGDMN